MSCELEQVLARSVATDPKDRPADARELFADFAAALECPDGSEKPLILPETIKAQLDRYARKRPVRRNAKAIATAVPTRAGVDGRVLAVAAITAAVVILVGFTRGASAHVSPIIATLAPPPSAAAAGRDCRDAWEDVRALLPRVIGPDGLRIERLLVELRDPLRKAPPGVFPTLLASALRDAPLAQLAAALRTACPVSQTDRPGAPVDRQLLNQLGALELLDELALSLGEAPPLGDAVTRALGAYAGGRELEPLAGDPVYGYPRYPPYKGDGEEDWTIELPLAPNADADLALVVNGMDPKAVLQVTVNRALTVNYRNRSGIAGGHLYKMPAHIIPGRGPGQMTLTPETPFPNFTVLTRRIPRSALVRGTNRLHLRVVYLPGPLRLPQNKHWPLATKMQAGSLWAAYVAFLESSKDDSR